MAERETRTLIEEARLTQEQRQEEFSKRVETIVNDINELLDKRGIKKPTHSYLNSHILSNGLPVSIELFSELKNIRSGGRCSIGIWTKEGLFQRLEINGHFHFLTKEFEGHRVTLIGNSDASSISKITALAPWEELIESLK